MLRSSVRPISELHSAVRELGARKSRAFTLVEVIVCLAILLLIMVIVASMVSQTSTLWKHTVGRVEQFREARDGFEAITRRLSQATLNTYWDYDNPNQPTKYIRQSELRFISGPQIVGTNNSTPPRPTDAVFFQAPLGFVVKSSANDTTFQNYQGMENLLNSWGYYVEYNDDSKFRPSFLTSTPRTRFRLMEYMESSPSLSLYQYEAQAGGNSKYTEAQVGTVGQNGGWAWFLNGVNYFQTANNNNASQTAPVHILAENVIALILLPKLTPAQQTANGQAFTDASLAPNYAYNSTGYDPTTSSAMTTVSNIYLDPINQLPPVIQVTMVAMDETSAIRLGDSGQKAILTQITSSGWFTNANNYVKDMAGTGNPPAATSGLEPYLNSQRINYRVFTTDVSIKGAKWSSYQTK